MRELDGRVKDLDDTTRYLLLSAFGPRFALYYNVSSDTYGMNEPVHATLFKRRAAALAMKRAKSGTTASGGSRGVFSRFGSRIGTT
jgi:hypothetical protein